MQDLDDGVTVGRGRLSAVAGEAGEKVRPFLDEVSVVPADRLLDVASALSDGASLVHARLRHLDPDDRDAILDMMASQLSGIVTLWADLVRSVVAAAEPESATPSQPLGQPLSSTHALSGTRVAAAGQSYPGATALPDTQSHPSAHVFATPVPTPGPEPEPRPEPEPGIRRLPRRDVVTPNREPWATPLRSVQVDQRSGDSFVPAADPDGDYQNDRLTRDELTGVLNRQAGFAALGRDLDRCRRAGERFVLGYLDVDGIKEVNAHEGRRAGDELLRKVTSALRATLRSYDVIMRLGGDEFLFSLPGADMATAELRANEFGVILAEEAAGGSASVGFAELGGNDTLDEIISRAESELVKNRRARVRSR